MNYRRTALALLVVGLLLTPGVWYVFAVDDLTGPDRYRSSSGYTATPVDVSNDTLLADRYDSRLTVRADSLRYRHVADDYAAPNETRRVLAEAIETGRATTSNDSVRADLVAIDEEYPFVANESTRDGVYALELSTDEGTTVARATRANDSAVADAVRRDLLVSYEALPTDEQATFDAIRNATVHDDWYRPWSDEPVPDEPLVRKGDTTYAVAAPVAVDDFNFPDGLLVGLVASALGVLSLLAAGLVAIVGYVRSEESQEVEVDT
ncbi:hypothetical protein SAMN04487949_0090 [Halogranum gelatinilyticum]|uniref:DUF7979 domain-containing protein n=1 Tax=Halogranum gelatinilyticum TaxID=660521 RepID=A0A1G9NSY3_9EURY|nr:hypothetical protein [Halogranum gelatinilyticum]SDL89423.1 hypothetical protein SAMN04487949_0090 [Halogranum gelatinilyticum]